MQNKKTVFLVCTGLGNINRGYESFTQECFENLKNNEAFNLVLLKGKGQKTNNEKVIGNIKRNSKLAKCLTSLTKYSAYQIEQFSFFICSIPFLLLYQPALIYYSDFQLGTYYWHLRKRVPIFSYKLLFSNGAPNMPPYTRTDHVQQLLAVHLQNAIAMGAAANSQTLLPYGIQVFDTQVLPALEMIEELKRKGKKIILTVGAINFHHKRMDYVIKESALLSFDFHLVIAGQKEEESELVRQLAESMLGNRYSILSFAKEEMPALYNSADFFVLASLTEGLPRVVIEAMSYGLPCFLHNNPINSEIGADFGFYVNMTKETALANRINNCTISAERNQAQVDYIKQSYSWKALTSKYQQMILTQMN